MAEINKIFPKSSISIQRVSMTTLCFIDNILVNYDKYALNEGRLDIYKESHDSVTLFYNCNTSNVYEFNVLLNNYGTVITGYDANNSLLQGLTNDNVLVFINGTLLSKDQYQVIDSSHISILTNYPQNYFQSVIIYVSIPSLLYQKIDYTYDEDSVSSLDKVFINYNIDTSMIFINGVKVDISNIEINSSDPSSTYIKINYPVNRNDLIEFYDFNSDTKSLNFISTFGYTSFGPIDSFSKKLPILYNNIITFDNIARLCVDNIRTGFFIKDVEHETSAIVVDTDFETLSVKCLNYSGSFSKSFYSSGQYYVEAPDVYSITNYLSEYDNSRRFLPEVLDVFQRVLLKEVYDSLKRLKDIRNISRVDSYNINKLIKLLGFDTNIKRLNLKQRHELLEELTEFYRRVGTRDSYNMFNIMQDNIKLISMEQLFTPSINRLTSNSEQYVTYDYRIVNEGSGYQVGNRVYFDIHDTDSSSNEESAGIKKFSFTVSELWGPNSGGHNPTGIKVIEPDISDGRQYTELEGNQELLPSDLGLNGKLSTTSTNYIYNWSLNNSNSGFNEGEILTDYNNLYKIKVTGVNNNGHITNYQILEGPTSGTTPFSLSNEQLRIVDTSDIKLSIETTELSREQILDATGNPGLLQSIVLGPGTYYYEMSGGSGSGAAGDSGFGGLSDIQSRDGNYGRGLKGEYVSGSFTNNITQNLTYIIGGAASSSGASGNDWLNGNNWAVVGSPGAGFRGGSYGRTDSKRVEWYYDSRRFHAHEWHYKGFFAASGSGGGSSRIFVDGAVNVEARGGRGGSYLGTCGNYTIDIAGGNGGGGVSGFYGDGVVGGNSSYDNRTLWSSPGNNGYIKIWKINYQYTGSIVGDTSQVHEGYSYTTPNNEFSVVINSMDGTDITNFTLTPSYGNKNYGVNSVLFRLNKVSENLTAKLSISSQLQSASYKISDLGGLTKYLYRDYQLTATISEDVASQYPAFTATGVVVHKNNRTGTVEVEWTFPNVIYADFLNVPMTITIPNGSGAILSTDFIHVTTRDMEREYVDFYTKTDLGAILKSDYIFPITEYGTINEPTPNSPNPEMVGLPDIDYGQIVVNPDEDDYIDYGKITDKIKGKWVRWWEWDRPSYYYPTNHVDLEIKIESTEDEEDLKNRFLDQFYNVASTVLYIHSLVYSYFFGNATKNVSSGVSSMDKDPILFGIQTGQPIEYQTVTLSADPQRQATTENLT